MDTSYIPQEEKKQDIKKTIDILKEFNNEYNEIKKKIYQISDKKLNMFYQYLIEKKKLIENPDDKDNKLSGEDKKSMLEATLPLIDFIGKELYKRGYKLG